VSGPTKLPSGLVTFMFTDIEGSTRLARMLGETYGAVLGAHRTVLRTALRYFGGVELFTEGDSFFVAFGDASSAVAASVAAQRALVAHDWPSDDVMPRVRMGLHTGWALPSGGEYASAEVHRAARVAAAAHGGQVLCSEATALATTTWSSDLEPLPATEFASAVTRQPTSGWQSMAGLHAMAGRPAMAGRQATETWQPGAGTATALADDRVVDLLELGTFRLRGFDDDERLFQIVAPGLDRDFPRPRTPGAAAHNLPAPVTSLVGRLAEVTELVGLVDTHRLVTVAGPGGAGKTRLALAAAEQLLATYPEGIWVIDCATAPQSLPAALAAVVGLRPEPGRPILDTLVERCAERRMLVVLETVDAAPMAAAALARRLLAACPHADVLATGREPLGVHGELVWRIPPLAPADAFTLLTERIEAARGGRTAGPGEAGDLARVASKVEGLPLAIELAASRLRLLSAAQLATRLDEPLSALDPANPDEVDAAARHDSLTATVDWSYRTLSERASALLRRLAVFAGPVDLATVEWCGDDALCALSELADKSLVEVLPGPRYRLSAPVREYAIRALSATGEEAAAKDRHVDWSLHALDGVSVDTDGQPRTVSLTALAPFVAEWEEALRWSADGGSVRAGLRLVRALDPWWREHGGGGDGRELLTRLYRRSGGEDVAPADLASAFLVHAALADDVDERARYLERAEALARRIGHSALLIRAQSGRRAALLEDKRPAAAEQLCRDVIARADQSGVPGAALPAVVTLAELLWHRNALEEAAELLGGARQVEAGRCEHRGRRTVDWLLGMVALRRGDLVAAHDHLVVALRSRLRHGFRGAVADAVAAIAVRCALGGDAVTAAVLFGGAESVPGVRRTAMFGAFWAAQQAALRATLGDAAFDAAYADGAEAGFDRTVATALAVEHPDLEHGSARFAQTLR
jgi:predicted ATPase/class 3 adenylate cyclase